VRYSRAKATSDTTPQCLVTYHGNIVYSAILLTARSVCDDGVIGHRPQNVYAFAQDSMQGGIKKKGKKDISRRCNKSRTDRRSTNLRRAQTPYRFLYFTARFARFLWVNSRGHNFPPFIIPPPEVRPPTRTMTRLACITVFRVLP